MDPKTRGIVAYITIIGWIVAIATNNPKDEHASFHIRQMLGLMLLSLAFSFCSVVPFLGWIVSFVGFFVALALWVMGLISAVQGTQKPVPVVGDKFQEWFKSL